MTKDEAAAADSEAVAQSIPVLPDELWMLWSTGGWVASIDVAPGGTTYLMATSEAEATEAAKHQGEMFYVDDCVPVRVYPR